MVDVNRNPDRDLPRDRGDNRQPRLGRDPGPDHLPRRPKYRLTQSQDPGQVHREHHGLDHAQDLVQENQHQDQNQDRYRDHGKEHNLPVQGKVLALDHALDLARDRLNPDPDLDPDPVPVPGRVLDHGHDPDHARGQNHVQYRNPPRDPVQVPVLNRDRVLNHDQDQDQNQGQLLDLDIPPDLNLDQGRGLVQDQNLGGQEAVARIPKALLEKGIEFSLILKKMSVGLRHRKSQNTEYQIRKMKATMK